MVLFKSTVIWVLLLIKKIRSPAVDSCTYCRRASLFLLRHLKRLLQQFNRKEANARMIISNSFVDTTNLWWMELWYQGSYFFLCLIFLHFFLILNSAVSKETHFLSRRHIGSSQRKLKCRINAPEIQNLDLKKKKMQPLAPCRVYTHQDCELVIPLCHIRPWNNPWHCQAD